MVLARFQSKLFRAAVLATGVGVAGYYIRQNFVNNLFLLNLSKMTVDNFYHLLRSLELMTIERWCRHYKPNLL